MHAVTQALSAGTNEYYFVSQLVCLPIMAYLSLVRNNALSIVSAERCYVCQIVQNCGSTQPCFLPASSVDSTVNGKHYMSCQETCQETH